MADTYRGRLHASPAISQETLADLVQTFGGMRAVGFEQMTRGYANEVHRCITAPGDDLYVRIQRRGRIPFSSEAWAMRRCREAGLPVPPVHGVTTIEAPDGTRDVMVLDATPGEPLASALARGTLPAATLWRQAGAALRIMHGIAVEHFGALSENDHQTRDWQSWIHTELKQRRADVVDVRAAGLLDRELDGLLEIIASLRTAENVRPVLCHGDLSADHIFFDNAGTLSGIIDFGMASGAPGIFDLAIILMFHPDLDPSWLWSGYTGEDAMPSAVTEQILALQANTGLSYLAHNERSGDTDSREVALMGLRAILKTWNDQ